MDDRHVPYMPWNDFAKVPAMSGIAIIILALEISLEGVEEVLRIAKLTEWPSSWKPDGDRRGKPATQLRPNPPAHHVCGMEPFFWVGQPDFDQILAAEQTSNNTGVTWSSANPPTVVHRSSCTVTFVCSSDSSSVQTGSTSYSLHRCFTRCARPRQ